MPGLVCGQADCSLLFVKLAASEVRCHATLNQNAKDLHILVPFQLAACSTKMLDADLRTLHSLLHCHLAGACSLQVNR